MQRRLARLVAGIAAAFLAGAGVARAEEAKHAEGEKKGGCAHCDKEKAESAAKSKKSAPETGAKITVVDRALLDQNGKTVRFGKDVVAGDVVVVDFVFTNCTTICPVLSVKMVRLQELLSARLGKGVKLVTMSLDPVRDTPERMKAWGAKFKAGPHWHFITGSKEDQEAVLKGLGAYVANFADHPPLALIGDGKTGRWVRINGFPDPKRMAALVEEMLAGRKPTTARTEGR